MIANAVVAAGEAVEAGADGGKASVPHSAMLITMMSTGTKGLSLMSSGFPSME